MENDGLAKVVFVDDKTAEKKTFKQLQQLLRKKGIELERWEKADKNKALVMLVPKGKPYLAYKLSEKATVLLVDSEALKHEYKVESVCNEIVFGLQYLSCVFGG